MKSLLLQTSYISSFSLSFTKGDDPEIIWEYLYDSFNIESMLFLNLTQMQEVDLINS